MSVRRRSQYVERNPDGQPGQTTLLVGGLGAHCGVVVATFLVRREETAEGDDRAAGTELNNPGPL